MSDSFAGGLARDLELIGRHPLARLRLVDSNNGCTPLAGYARYLWHCDRDGEYSLYTLPDQSWLRGLQVSNEYGWLSFVTISPGCYPGRFPHMHFEVFPGLSSATSGSRSILTSQLAMPADACTTIYRRSGYSATRGYFANTSLASDGIFADDSAAELALMTPAIWYNPTMKCFVGKARIEMGA